jgi:Putative auto-transporter adhesin, head GIN domain
LHSLKTLNMKRLFFVSILSIVVLSSCHHFFGERVHGNGNIKSEGRKTGQFISVDVGGNINVYIKQDSVRSIRVEADENLLPYIEVISEGDKIYIHEMDGYNLSPSGEIKVYVSSPVFKSLEASGACDIYGENQIISTEGISIGLSGSSNIKMDIKASKVDADLSGACTVELKGEAKEFKVEGSGSTDIKCIDLVADNVDIDISGSGEAEVYANTKLNVQVSGSGDVRYKGNASVTQDVSGAGSVKKVDSQ